MSKADDDARNTGSPQAGRAASGERAATGSDNSAPAGPSGVPRATKDASRPSRRAADGPMDAVREAGVERDPQARARSREALVETPTRRQVRVQQAHPGAGRSVADAADGRSESAIARPFRAPVPGGRRDRREQHTRQMAAVARDKQPAVASKPVVLEPLAAETAEARRIEDMSVEEALAARLAIVADARDQVATIDASGVDDPFSVDVDVLAQQKALAERAAVLNSRARRLQELSEQNQQRKPEWSDPASPDNLSIVAPPEFVRLPGGTRMVLRAPTTTHIPVVLPRPAQGATATPAVGDGAKSEGSSRPIPASGQALIEPVQARSAFGLEPLDAMTAGLGRRRRVRYLQYSMLVVGAAALATGIIMTVSSLNG